MAETWESISVVLIPPWKDETAMIVWCVYLAVVGVWIYSLLHRSFLGKNVAILKGMGCVSVETAKEAGELKGFSAKWVSPYDRLVERVSAEGKADRFYFPEDREKKAESLLKGSQTKWWKMLLGLFGCYILMVLAYYFAPTLFEIFKDLSPFQ